MGRISRESASKRREAEAATRRTGPNSPVNRNERAAADTDALVRALNRSTSKSRNFPYSSTPRTAGTPVLRWRRLIILRSHQVSRSGATTSPVAMQCTGDTAIPALDNRRFTRE